MAEQRAESLEELAAALRELISLAEAGNWEQLILLEARIAELDQALRQRPGSGPRPSPKAVDDLIGLHAKAIQLCRQRMETIAPLVRAFDDSPNNESKP